MNNQSAFRAIAVTLFAVAVIAGVAFTAYNMGVEHATTAGARVITAPPGTPYVYVYPRPWGFGFGFFPFLFILFGFFALRRLFWRGAWRGGYGYHRCMQSAQPVETPPEVKV